MKRKINFATNCKNHLQSTINRLLSHVPKNNQKPRHDRKPKQKENPSMKTKNKKASKRSVELATTGQNIAGKRKLTVFAGSQYTLGQATVTEIGAASTVVTVIAATPDGKRAIVRDSAGSQFEVKFANFGVPMVATDAGASAGTVKGWPRA